MADDGDDHSSPDDVPLSENPIGNFEPGSEPSKLELRYEEDVGLPRDGGLKAAVDEMNEVAERYRRDGWETVTCHPGGVSVLTGDRDDGRVGIEVVVADNELDEATDALEDGSFETYQVFRGTVLGVVLFVVAVEDPTNETALLFAGYFHPQDGEPLFAGDDTADSFGAYLRAVSGEYVELDSIDVEFFRPELDQVEDEAEND